MKVLCTGGEPLSHGVLNCTSLLAASEKEVQVWCDYFGELLNEGVGHISEDSFTNGNGNIGADHPITTLEAWDTIQGPNYGRSGKCTKYDEV